MISAIYKAFNSKGKRRIAVVVAFFITILLTILMALGVTNLINTNHQLDRATYYKGVKLALKYCEYSQENGIDFDAIAELLQDEFQDKWQSTSSEERQEYATRFGVQDTASEDEIFRATFEIMNLWLLRELVLEDADSINIEMHPKGQLPFRSLVLQEEELLEGMDKSAVGVSEFLEILKQKENFEISQLFDKFSNLSDLVFLLRFNRECEWHIRRVLPVPTLDLIQQLFVAGSRFEFDSTEFYFAINNMEVTESPISAVNVYRNFDMWDGGYMLSWTNPQLHLGDIGNSNPIQFSMLLPNNPSNFLDNAILLILCVWIFLSLVFVIVIGRLISGPLRFLSRASSKAGTILAKKENVPENLKRTREEFHAGTSEFPEFEKLIRETENLLMEREVWLGEHLHQLKNDLIAISYAVRNMESSEGSASSTIEDVENLINRISTVFNSVVSYQVTLYGKPEPKTLVDLGSVIETVRDEIEDAGGNAICKGDDSIYLSAQSAALQSAFQNLIWNAHHHGGKVSIEFRKIYQGKKVEVIIDDDGPGIKDEEIEEMFEPYRQGKIRAHKSAFPFRGAGLGLTIAKHIVSEHGGEIALSNRRTDDGRIAGFES